MAIYDHKKIERKWQQRWKKDKAFKTPTSAKAMAGRPAKKMYVLDMFPYPSGSALHVGHPKGYIATDIFSRYHRMKGYEVLHPMGWDAFGLPAENYAIKNKVHPRMAVEENIKRFKEQLEVIGFDYDWSREINTTDPEYYKWTQWIFLQLFKAGLAYESNEPVNWCPKDKTVLANEDVEDGKCEQCGTPVELKPMRQWVLKITAYADKMLEGLKDLDWPESIKISQENWIGRSEGVNFKMKVKDLDIDFKVYDSVPQTFMAQTFVVIAPEHPLLPQLVAGMPQEREVLEFAEDIRRKKLAGKFDVEKDMEGMFTGRYTEDPFGTGDLPIWVASFVVMGYGTGIVNSSAHDERDFAFAKKYGIPLRPVMFPADKEKAKQVRNLEFCYAKDPEAIMEQPKEFAGRKWGEVRGDIIDFQVKKGIAERAVNYKMRDWVFSRQRYWGEPIPIIHCEKCGTVPVLEGDLPVELPEVDHYEPTGTGESPLANIEGWVNVKCPNCEGPAKRETNTMPQWAGSSWYYLRYIDPKSRKALVDKKKEKSWMPVDMYVGGAEHATRHLIYARFWHRFLYDEGRVSTPEPFARLQNVGLIAGEDGRKMSKRWGNVVNPDDMVEKYGADALRLLEMFLGPFNQGAAWSTAGVAGTYRFLKRLWSVFNVMAGSSDSGRVLSAVSPPPHSAQRATRGRSGLGPLPSGASAKLGPQPPPATAALELKLHQTVKRVTESTANFRFNVAVAAFMEFLNELEKQESVSKEVLETFVLLLSPYAPHMAEELWEKLGHTESLVREAWPEADEKILAAAQVTIPVQVNGKVRAVLTADPGVTQAQVEELARDDQNVRKYLEQGEVKKVVYVPDKLLNFVVK
ncbi:MAG: leucine--tRNA ligase [Patescibacteria group bacterium]